MLSNYLMGSTKAHVCKTFAFLVLKFDVLSALTMILVMFVSALGSLLGLLLWEESNVNTNDYVYIRPASSSMMIWIW